MPTPTMRYLYRWRRPLLLVTVFVVALAVWLLVADILEQVYGGRWFYLRLKRQLTYLAAPDVGLRGLFAVETHGPVGQAIWSASVLIMTATTVVLFIHPRRGWKKMITSQQNPHIWSTMSVSFVAAVTTVGYAALGLDWLGLWSPSPRSPLWFLHFRIRDISFNPGFGMSMVLLAPAWWAWFRKLRDPKRDVFIAMVMMTYALFVAAGILMLIAVPLQIYVHLLYEFNRGSYTAMVIGAGVMVWTLIPSMLLIWFGEYYHAVTRGLCIVCMYNLQGVEADHCPECGHSIDRTVYLRYSN